jgi:hypothetical protein|tara:strand:- start:44 stop:328 length:285 start_codon:yes stop_codon:yes gene_type:complete
MNDNKLIAEFMGMDSFKDSLASLHQGKINVDVDVYEQAQYHTSWDWLMPVVDKIEQVNEGVPEQMLHVSLYSTIDEVYEAVVEFIKLINTQPPS